MNSRNSDADVPATDWTLASRHGGDLELLRSKEELAAVTVRREASADIQDNVAAPLALDHMSAARSGLPQHLKSYTHTTGPTDARCLQLTLKFFQRYIPVHVCA